MKCDYEKGNLSIRNGWKILQIEPKEVCLLETVEMIRKVLAL